MQRQINYDFLRPTISGFHLQATKAITMQFKTEKIKMNEINLFLISIIKIKIDESYLLL